MKSQKVWGLSSSKLVVGEQFEIVDEKVLRTTTHNAHHVSGAIIIYVIRTTNPSSVPVRMYYNPSQSTVTGRL
jgi:hypothetical protein